ncbi:4-hydroxybenzoate polyprenyltransferase [Natronorubrum texcoconense]|uniref:4-hydroxybenzoate polyprenyltransferase n=2 Tax=Natronorubrum texcoconense TaxID=1095776 RepID=A0A1G9D7B7_9EURY|nr:4-hydroxybenzoate polyprenyltransferase [Natronorubrum texcoconense]
MSDPSVPSRTRLERRGHGLWVHVQPIFLVPGAAMSVFGTALATDISVSSGAIHAFAVCLAVYVAHLKDGYVDYYVRGEDERNPLEPREIRLAIAVATILFGLCLGLLWQFGGPIAAVATAPLLVLGYFHAPQLDTHPLTVTVDYPLGICLATVGGYATQTGTVSDTVLAVCLTLFLLLAAINIMLDRLDYDHDRRLAKRTLPVVLGPTRAQRIAWGLIGACLVVLLVSSLFGPLPTVAALAGAVPGAVTLACLVRPLDPNRLVALFIGVTYVFATMLFIAIRISG